MHNSKFEEYFQSIYEKRWETLKESLLAKDKKILRPTFSETNISTDQFESYLKDLAEFNETNREKLNLLIDEKKKFYAMDAASIFAATLLDIKENDDVLDMCAAPGGKSLILLEKISSGQLTVNEFSMNRRSKLKNVLREYAPEDKLNHVTVKGLDAALYGIKMPNAFDAILLDAPCSGEKHLVQTPKELEKWSLKRSKRLAAQQFSMLCSALLSLKSGGSLIYSTCSISPLENDQNIQKLIDKKGDQFELDLPEIYPSFLEKTEFGLIALPDHKGFGPLYITRMRKR